MTRKELDAVISRFSRLLQKFPNFTILGQGQSIKITRAFVEKCRERTFAVKKDVDLSLSVPKLSTRDMALICRYFVDMFHLFNMCSIWIRKLSPDQKEFVASGKLFSHVYVMQNRVRARTTQWHESQMRAAVDEYDRCALTYMMFVLLDGSRANVEFCEAWELSLIHI